MHALLASSAPGLACGIDSAMTLETPFIKMLACGFVPSDTAQAR